MHNLAFDLQKDKPLRDDDAPIRGYRMITSFDIQNFRCFERLSLKDLRTINIIVGDNGSGKTALLEALLLAARAHPQAATFIRMARNRPGPQGQVTWSRDFFESFWEDLFFDFSHSKTITATFTDSLIGNFKVRVYYEMPVSEPAFSPVASIPRLVFERTEPNGSTITKTQIKIDEQGNPIFEGLFDQSPAVYILPSTAQFYAQEMVDYFSALSRQNLEGYVIEAMQKDFPQISNISILTDGNVPGLFVTTKSAAKTKIPLAVVSSGAAWYLNILLAIANTTNGVVLIDEIENGIYWHKLPNIWERLRDLCVSRSVQIFATTHSNECLQSLARAIKGHEKNFSLIRTEVTKGKHQVKHFDGEKFLAALEQRGEIR